MWCENIARRRDIVELIVNTVFLRENTGTVFLVTKPPVAWCFFVLCYLKEVFHFVDFSRYFDVEKACSTGWFSPPWNRLHWKSRVCSLLILMMMECYLGNQGIIYLYKHDIVSHLLVSCVHCGRRFVHNCYYVHLYNCSIATDWRSELS